MSLSRRIARVLRNEGAPGLARAAMSLVRRLVWRVVFVGDFYVYRYPVPATDEHIPGPEIEGVEVHIVESDRDVENLVAAGYDDARVLVDHAATRLGAGAIGFFAYVNKEIAHVGWVGLSDAATHAIDCLPYRVDYEAGEACTGGSWTFPSFRGRGLYAYVFGHELRYLCNAGRTVCRNAIDVNNVASQRGQARYGARLCAGRPLLSGSGLVSMGRDACRGALPVSGLILIPLSGAGRCCSHLVRGASREEYSVRLW